MKKIKENSKDFTEEMAKQLQAQNKYLHVINKDLRRKRRQEVAK